MLNPKKRNIVNHVIITMKIIIKIIIIMMTIMIIIIALVEMRNVVNFDLLLFIFLVINLFTVFKTKLDFFNKII